MSNIEIPEKSRWSVQFLTTEYLVDGFVDGNKEKNILDLNAVNFSQVLLNGVSYQPTGLLSAPQPAKFPWAVLFSNEIIAMIPNDQASMAFALKANSNIANPLAMEVTAGQYVMRGSFMFSIPFEVEAPRYQPAMIGKDVQVDSVLPHTQWTGFKAPYMIFTNKYIHTLAPLT